MAPPFPLSPLRLLKPIRDRALDHAVEKEKHLKPFLSLKNHLLSTPNPNPNPNPLPLSSLAALSLPLRPIDFLRLFPHAFSLQDLSTPHPSLLPSPSLSDLHHLELQTLAQNHPILADRLLRLLMLSPSRQLPLHLLHRLQFDLSLPADFPSSLLPHFPHFFRLLPSSLDLVSYRKPLAVSSLESFALRTGGYSKNSPLPFPLHFSTGFQLDKASRKWLDEWQRIPYISPYDSVAACGGKGEVVEKWVVGVLHEVLSLLVGKKTELKNLVMVGKCLGLPGGFARLVKYHHGIFYVSSKLGTDTVMLRDAYKRDRLVEKDPLMEIRYKYIHLMRMGKQGDSKKMKKGKKSRRGKSEETFVEGEEVGLDEEDEDDKFDDDEVELSASSEEESDDEATGFSRNKISAVSQ